MEPILGHLRADNGVLEIVRQKKSKNRVKKRPRALGECSAPLKRARVNSLSTQNTYFIHKIVVELILGHFSADNEVLKKKAKEDPKISSEKKSPELSGRALSQWTK